MLLGICEIPCVASQLYIYIVMVGLRCRITAAYGTVLTFSGKSLIIQFILLCEVDNARIVQCYFRFR